MGARESPLSQIQVQEVLTELRHYYPDMQFETLLMKSSGDKDKITSLRTLGKSDFFTKEIDDMVLSGQCRVGLHSAKDLPEPLPKGLKIVAITKGLDSSDSLVLAPGVETLQTGSIVATSSERREEAVSQLYPDKEIQFVDIRGTIGERLAKLKSGTIDGVVIAEAALIRLGLTSLNRVRLPGTTTPFQGQLAVIAREDDLEMARLFAPLHNKEGTTISHTILYLGLTLPDHLKKTQHVRYLHYPVIRTVPHSPSSANIKQSFNQMQLYTHLLFTSKTAVRLFFEYLPLFGHQITDLHAKHIIAVGQATAAQIREYDTHVDIVAQRESSEGIIDVLQKEDLSKAHLFWPHSALSRPVITTFLRERLIAFQECTLYDTVKNFSFPKPNLAAINEIFFTSPSTVDAFLNIFGSLPSDKKVTPIGEITADYLNKIKILH